MKTTHPWLHPMKTALLLLAGCLLSVRAQIPMATEPLDRAHKTEVYGIGQYLHSEDITFAGPKGDVTMAMDDTGLGGIGFGYHLNNYLSVRTELLFGSANFRGDLPTAAGGTVAIQQDVLVQTGRLNLDYNIINRRLTPFVTAGIGYQYLEAELDQLPPAEVCWWDPWWGWVCSDAQPIASDFQFTWNAGVGVRWDINDHLFVKVLAGANWVQYSGAQDLTTQFEAVFSLGWSF